MVLRDILDALNSLHLKNICHGSVYLQSVFVEKRSGVYRGVLDFFPFNNSVSFIPFMNCCIATTFQRVCFLLKKSRGREWELILDKKQVKMG